MVIWVTDEELETFIPLIPEDMREYVRAGEWFCLGALPEAAEGEAGGEEYAAAGVLLFSDEDGVCSGEEKATAIVLKWFYVAEEYRNRGIGNALMQAFSETLEDVAAEGIICDLPFDSEYDAAEAFLISWGFDFTVISSTEMIITKEDFRGRLFTLEEEKLKTAMEGAEEPEGLFPVADLPEPIFAEALQEIREKDPLGYYDMLSEEKEDYEEGMSYVILENNRVSSMALFERLPDGDLHMLLLASIPQAKDSELSLLLAFAAGCYDRDYPDETRLILTLNTERSMNLAVWLFPDQEPAQIRRGFFV